METNDSVVQHITKMSDMVKSKLGQLSESQNENTHKYNVEDSVSDFIEKIQKNPSVALNDAYGNSLTGTGTDDKALQFTKYVMSNDTLNWPLWMTMYNDSWVFRTAIDKPARDEIRCGITINNESLTNQYDDIYKWYKKYSTDLIEILKWGALFGGSIGVCLFDNFNDDDYSKSITTNIKKVQSAKKMRMYVVDRWYGVAPSNSNVSSMKSLDFGKPTYYDITFADGKTKRIHHDYILRYEHRTAPKLVKNGMLQGWGYAEGCHIINELIQNDQINSATLSLLNKALIEVIKMAGMRGLFMGTDPQNEAQLNARLEMVNWARNFNSLTLLDKEDEYEMKGFSGLTGLADILSQKMWQISASLEMEGVLFGELKGGLNTQSDALEHYSDTINGRCESWVRPVIEKFLWIYYRMKGYKVLPEFTFNLLARKKEDKDKMEAMSSFVDLCSKLLADGVIDTKQYAISLRDYTNRGVASFNFTDKDLDKLEENFDEEMEDISQNIYENENEHKKEENDGNIQTNNESK